VWFLGGGFYCRSGGANLEFSARTIELVATQWDVKVRQHISYFRWRVRRANSSRLEICVDFNFFRLRSANRTDPRIGLLQCARLQEEDNAPRSNYNEA
jgi:hypothetical protein